jgi:endoglucanase
MRINTWGYHPKANKVIVLEDVPVSIASGRQALTINVISTNQKDLFKHDLVVLKLKPERYFKGKESFSNAWATLNLNALTIPGTYRLQLDTNALLPLHGFGERLKQALKSDVPGHPPEKKQRPPVITSAPIVISPYLYWDAIKPLMRAFYLSRADQAVEDPLTQLSRPLPAPKLLHDAFGHTVNASGGWLEGDLHRNVDGSDQSVSQHALSLVQLLAARTIADASFKVMTLDYPSQDANASGLSDTDNELHIGLDWLQAMQQQTPSPGSSNTANTLVGSFYAGIKDATLLPPTPESTAMASASLARAARVYRKNDLGYSVQCLRAAERGWAWLQHNQPILSMASPKIQLLALNQQAALLWVSAELYLSTGKPVYLNSLKTLLPKVSPTVWAAYLPASTGLLQGVNALLQPNSVSVPEGIKLYLVQRLQAGSDQIIYTMAKNPYGVPLSGFGADSNGLLLAQCNWLLATAQSLSGTNVTLSNRYREAAASSLNWLFGLNPMGRTFTTTLEPFTPDDQQKNLKPSVVDPLAAVSQLSTGAIMPQATTGLKSGARRQVLWVKFPSSPIALHTPNGAVPGLVVSGPNTMAPDNITPPNRGPASYRDQATAWASNSNHLTLNASLINVLAQLNQAYQ